MNKDKLHSLAEQIALYQNNINSGIDIDTNEDSICDIIQNITDIEELFYVYSIIEEENLIK